MPLEAIPSYILKRVLYIINIEELLNTKYNNTYGMSGLPELRDAVI